MGAVGLVSSLVFVLVPVALLGSTALVAVPSARRSAWGLATGGGVALLLVAYLQREGPGTSCWRTATASGCDQHLNPLPWLLAGLALGIIGIAAHHAARSLHQLRHRAPRA
jgi:hypothetical protein